MEYIEVTLTLLTLLTGILAVLTFINGRNKDSKTSGQQIGAMCQQIDDIDRRTEQIYAEVSEIRNTSVETGKTLASAQESAKLAHKRIDALEDIVQKLISSRKATE